MECSVPSYEGGPQRPGGLFLALLGPGWSAGQTRTCCPYHCCVLCAPAHPGAWDKRVSAGTLRHSLQSLLSWCSCALPFSLGKPRHQRLGCESWTDSHPRRPLYAPRLPLQSGFAAPDLRTGPWLTGTLDTPQKPTTDPTAHGAQLPFPKAGSGHLSSAQKPAVAPVAQ